jgi:non-heme chloroperoxidase
VSEPLRAALASGLTLPYVVQGEPSGVPVVLLHAYAESWRSFGRVLEHLPPSLRAFAPTQRGHGDADRPDSGYRLEDLGHDLSAFMDAVGLEAAVIAGGSSGGYVAQRFAVDSPARTLGLVLVGSPLDLREKAAGGELAGAVAALDDPVDRAFVAEFAESCAFAAVPREFMDAMLADGLQMPARVWKAALAGLAESEPPTAAGTITAPTVIVWGERDAFVPREEAEALAAAIPDSRLVIYEETGHTPHWERPERVAADIVALARGHLR